MSYGIDVSTARPEQKTALNKVPQVTIYFWVIKVLCTTVGETAADFLNVNLNLGLTLTSVIMALLLVVALVIQFRRDRYVPWVYWLAVALISVVGTLVTDNLSDNLGVPLEVSTVVFSVVLTGVFAWWYTRERTLSIHSIITPRREGFYWLAILFTFALGTAAGDLMAEVLGLGYLVTGIIIVTVIVLTAIAWRVGLDAVLSFWIIYILTRPLGASIGDGLSQPSSQGGLGLGATGTSFIFTGAIIVLVGYLTLTKADVVTDVVTEAPAAHSRAVPGSSARWQTAIVVALVLVAGVSGYCVRKSALAAESTAPAPGGQDGAGLASPAVAPSPLGDLSSFRVITQGTLDLLVAGKQSAATSRVTDLETAWDNAEARLKPRDKTAWTSIDKKIDTVLRELRSTNPQPANEKAALTTLLGALGAQPPLPARPAPPRSPLGDLSSFRVITQGTLDLLVAGKQSAATSRVTDLETAWDNAEARLKPRDKTAWTSIDKKIDTVLRELRSTNPQPANEKAALTTLLGALR